MHDTYFVEERSGVIGLGPLTNSPDLYYRRTKTNWHSSSTWIHLIICLLAIPLIIWNLYVLMTTITLYTQVTVDVEAKGEEVKYTSVHPFGLFIVISAILMNLLGGVFALVTEAASFSDKIAKFLYVMVYLTIAITIFVILTQLNLHPLWLILIFIFMISFGLGFWRFIIISAIYLNEEGPLWYKPLLYGCLAAIPILTTSSQCRDAKNIYGCLPNDLFGGRTMQNDFFSFVLMTLIAVVSFLPYLFGTPNNE